VAAVDLNAEAAKETAAAVGGEVQGLGADVTDSQQVSEVVDQVVGAWGRLDTLFNCAGLAVQGAFLDADEADYERCFAVNVKGTVLCSRAAVPHLSAGGAGAIVNVASVAGLVGVRNTAAYTASKGAVVSLTRSMAVDLAPLGIRVNAICPGTVFTPMMEPLLLARGKGDREAGLAETVAKYPLGRLGRPEEIAHVALFLGSDDASFVTGSIIAADGGMTTQ
jgi:NAD(P)-dependent dehydrogenase (short-subunit alcohol dehydrogenase family)